MVHHAEKPIKLIQIKAVTSCSTHKIDQQETDKNQNTAFQILGESSTNPRCYKNTLPINNTSYG